MKEDDPRYIAPNRRPVYQYSVGGSTTTLRLHAMRLHLTEYRANSFDTMTAGSRSQSRSKFSATSGACAVEDAPREEFNEGNFHKRLVEFIIADDQVCLHH
jgi:hypothetical protein